MQMTYKNWQIIAFIFKKFVQFWKKKNAHTWGNLTEGEIGRRKWFLVQIRKFNSKRTKEGSSDFKSAKKDILSQRKPVETQMEFNFTL